MYRGILRHRFLGRVAFVAGLILLRSGAAHADNPIIQTSYTADPAPMVHEGKLYLYTSHDEDVTVNNFYTMNDWHLYSTEDMVNWTDLGTPASLDTFSWSTDNAWAPQGIARNGKYYLYLPINNNTGAKIGVAVSDSVTGPFTDPLGKQLAASGSGNIDPTVFIDDDEQAYMYWGNGTLRYVKLNFDMITTSGAITNVQLSGFTEGPWFYKREGIYYMIYAATNGTEYITYATSNSPTGPWTTRQEIMAKGSTFTNHAGIVDFKGHSYFFYHNSALPGGNDFRRSVCVEEFTYGNDGSIPKLTMSQEGPEAVATLNPYAQVEAETIAFSSGLKTEACADEGGGMNVRAIGNNDYIKVKNVDFIDGVTGFEARVSGSGNGAAIELHLDSASGTLLGTCDVSGAASWTTKSCTATGGSGIHDLFLVFKGNGDDAFKFNWWKFSGVTMPNEGTGGAAGTGGNDGNGGALATGGSDSAGGADSGTGGVLVASGGALVTGGASSNVGGSPVVPATGGTGGAILGSSGGAPAAGGQAPLGGVDGTAEGCSCRVGAGSSRSGASIALLLSAFALQAVRRRRQVR